jgi:hypothetical protein
LPPATSAPDDFDAYYCACANDPVYCGERMPRSRLAAMNRDRLTQLSVGMTRREVLEFMGTESIQTFTYHPFPFRRDLRRIHNPYRIGVFEPRDGGKPLEVHFYYTGPNTTTPPQNPRRTPKGEARIADYELTPIVVRGGRMVGMNWWFLDAHAALSDDPTR